MITSALCKSSALFSIIGNLEHNELCTYQYSISDPESHWCRSIHNHLYEITSRGFHDYVPKLYHLCM